MALKWTDSLDIAIELDEKYPDVDPQHIRFTDLHKWICELDNFEDDPEKIKELLIKQVFCRVRWRESILKVKNFGINKKRLFTNINQADQLLCFKQNSNKFYRCY